ncbi:glycerophosphodiester phosphodiesterase family protein [Vibrio mediterranei]|uniref:Glycerophosphoryl diester phosphodiesterase n=1 Tax=Vibrio mediterranei TaxID=689 RepID=A0AAN1FIP9_9VIBR|nr:glycerophosphodiester phosphodiesterase family protein [Vibrio mediterranei]ASI91293.1 glycerophosphoryl diester phosphodiesterase [Vibrio mediterranei]
MSTLIAGHRGVAGTHPENTLVSIQAAKKAGLTWVEVDIQPTRDDILVVCHDHTINRCSNGTGRIDELTFEQLSQFDFGSWKAPQFAGERLMAFDELLNYCQTNQLSINIEIKVDKHDAEHVVALLAERLNASEIDRNQLLISSFSREVMLALYEAKLGVRLGVLGNRLNNRLLKTIDEVEAFSCHLNYRWLTQTHIRTLRERGLQIWCYTVNNPKSFKHLQQVDAIFSDYPQRFMNLV